MDFQRAKYTTYYARLIRPPQFDIDVLIYLSMRSERKIEAIHPSPWGSLSHLHSSNQHRDANENANQPIYERGSLLLMISQRGRRFHLPTKDEPLFLAGIELNKIFSLKSAAMGAHQAFKIQTQQEYDFVLCCGRCEVTAVEY